MGYVAMQDLSPKSPDIMLGVAPALGLAPWPTMPQFPPTDRVGAQAGVRGQPYIQRWTLSLVIYDKDVHGGCAACGSHTVWVSAKKRLQTSGVRPRGLLLRIAGLVD